jgi:hypothetical protein
LNFGFNINEAVFEGAHKALSVYLHEEFALIKSIPEAAAMYDVSILFHPLNNGSYSAWGRNSDGLDFIHIDPNLPLKAQWKEFYECMICILTFRFLPEIFTKESNVD